MDWKVVVGLMFLAAAIVMALVIAMYASVSKYAKQFDPAQRTPREPPPPQDGQP